MLSAFAAVLAAAVLAVGSLAPSPSATPSLEQAALDRLFTSAALKPEWFAPDVLTQVPLAQLQQIVAGVKARLGAYKGSTPNGAAQYLADFDKGSVPTDIKLDAQGRIAGIFFHQAVLSGAATPAPAAGAARALTPGAALARLFTAKAIDPDWFAQSVLTEIPLSYVAQLVNGYKAELGNFVRVDGSGTSFTVVLDRGSVPSLITLDAAGRITGLRFLRAPRATPVSLSQAVAQLRALPGSTSLFVTGNGRTLSDDRSTVPLAVGSAFKLAVLNALVEQIRSKRRRWSDVVFLQNGWRSLPSGMLQGWPARTALTLQTLATLMISISDNTAADALLNTVGRAAAEAFAPHDRPLLTTREAFILQSKRNPFLAAMFLNGPASKRRAVLSRVDRLGLPGIGDLGGAVISKKIEWFFSTRELCGLMDKVAALPLMSVNPGVANPSDWARVAFKGGSDSGVLNLTTWLKAKNGETYCVSATWNDRRDVDETKFSALYSGIIAGLR